MIKSLSDFIEYADKSWFNCLAQLSKVELFPPAFFLQNIKVSLFEYCKVVQIVINESMMKFGHCFLRVFLNEKISKDIVGKDVIVTLRSQHQFSGFVQGIHQRFQILNKEGGFLTDIEILTLDHKLSFHTDCRVFEDKVVNDVLVAMGKDVNVKIKDDVTQKHTKQNLHMQFNESNLNFFRRLCYRYGIAYFYSHQDKCVRIFDDNTVFKMLDKFSSDSEGILMQHRTKQFKVNDFNFEEDKENLQDKEDLSDGIGAFYMFPNFYKKKPEAKGVLKAKIRSSGYRKGHRIVSGEFLPGIGDIIKSNDGEFICVSRYGENLVQISHEGELMEKPLIQTSWLISKDELLGVDENDFVQPTAFPQTAIVIGSNEEDQIITDNLCRVKVKFHWHSDDVRSQCFVRVSQALAGHNYGAVIMPRVGQEVLVQFCNNDLSNPVIVGSLYNKSHQPAYADLLKYTSYIKTETIGKKGAQNSDSVFCNEIVMSDESDKEKLVLGARKDLEVNVTNDYKEKVMKNKTVTIKEGSYSFIDQKGDFLITLEDGKMEVQVKKGNMIFQCGNGDFKIDASSGTVTIKCKKLEFDTEGDVKIESKGKLEFSGQSIDIASKSSLKMAGQESVNLSGTSIEAAGKSSVKLSAGASSITAAAQSCDINAPMINLN